MIKIRQLLGFLACCLLWMNSGLSQELNATVRISVPKLQTADPEVFRTMEVAIRDFMNSTKWSLVEYEEEERIECAFQINILEELSNNVFSADVAIQTLRPVYGTDYKTAVISHVDKNVIITYEQFQPIQENRETFSDNLSSVLTYYAYLILGYDNDTFSPFGGDQYFQVAQGIINNIPPSVLASDQGWSSLDNKANRYYVLENMLSPRVRPFRQAMYLYHRQGLDYMVSDIAQGQTSMQDAIIQLDDVRTSYPNTAALQIFSNAKGDEIIEVFKAADRSTKNRVLQVMRKVDVARANKYDVLRT